MPHDLTRLANKLDGKTAACRAVVETPKGHRGKFDYDPKLRTFRLKTMLPDGMSFPMDFGFVPSTLAEDGDPTDVMILNDEPCPTGTLLDVRLIGVIEGEDEEDGKTERNDRLLAVSSVSHLYADVKQPADLGDHFIDNLVQFWVNKDRLEGKAFRCLGVKGPKVAAELVKRTAKAAQKA
jgi:inorganic pyrophosphatase